MQPCHLEILAGASSLSTIDPRDPDAHRARPMRGWRPWVARRLVAVAAHLAPSTVHVRGPVVEAREGLA